MYINYVHVDACTDEAQLHFTDHVIHTVILIVYK